jgi:hypothetical protein
MMITAIGIIELSLPPLAHLYAPVGECWVPGVRKGIERQIVED